jgi:radical SAM superfamily enzyme YgiQ (UPF0313 family)
MDLLLSNSYYMAYEPMEGARGQPYPSLGILYLAAYLREKKEWETDIFDATFSKGLDDFEKTLQRYRPAVTGIQSVITTRIATRQMIEIAHRNGTKVVVGGPDSSCSTMDYLKWGADVVVIGEGEETLHELMQRMRRPSFHEDDLLGVAGLAFYHKRREEVMVTEPRAPIKDPDRIPFPAYSLIDVPRYLEAWRAYNGYSSMHLTTSRGCPYQCIWCSHSVFGSSYRQRSAGNVAKEMKYLVETYHPDHFTIADDTLGINWQWLHDWRKIIQEEQIITPFRCFSRANLVNEQVLKELKLAGCRHIFLGVETGSQKVLDAMKKGIAVEDVRRAAKLIHEHQIDLGFFIMFAFPGETATDIQKTVDLIFELKPESLGMSLAYPVPGTGFHEMVKDRIIHKRRDTEESMGSGRELYYKAAYPLSYYLAVIRYIELTRLRKDTKLKTTKKVLCLLQGWLCLLYLQISK